MEVRVIDYDFIQDRDTELQEYINKGIEKITDEELTILDVKVNNTTNRYIMTLICVKNPVVAPVSGPIMGPPIITG